MKSCIGGKPYLKVAHEQLVLWPCLRQMTVYGMIKLRVTIEGYNYGILDGKIPETHLKEYIIWKYKSMETFRLN